MSLLAAQANARWAEERCDADQGTGGSSFNPLPAALTVAASTARVLVHKPTSGPPGHSAVSQDVTVVRGTFFTRLAPAGHSQQPSRSDKADGPSIGGDEGSTSSSNKPDEPKRSVARSSKVLVLPVSQAALGPLARKEPLLPSAVEHADILGLMIELEGGPGLPGQADATGEEDLACTQASLNTRGEEQGRLGLARHTSASYAMSAGGRSLDSHSSYGPAALPAALSTLAHTSSLPQLAGSGVEGDGGAWRGSFSRSALSPRAPAKSAGSTLGTLSPSAQHIWRDSSLRLAKELVTNAGAEAQQASPSGSHAGVQPLAGRQAGSMSGLATVHSMPPLGVAPSYSGVRLKPLGSSGLAAAGGWKRLESLHEHQDDR